MTLNEEHELMREALEIIAADASVQVDAPDKMYKGWRNLATKRIDIARDALSKID